MTAQDAPTSLIFNVPLLSRLDDNDRARLIPLVRSRFLNAGDVLFRQGDPTNAIHVLVSGQVRIAEDRGGERRSETVLGRRGDVTGELSPLAEEMRSGTAVATEPTLVLELSKTDLESFLLQSPSAAVAAGRILARRLQTADQPSLSVRSPGKIFLLFCVVGPWDRARFILNLSLAAMEQSRRKTLLVDIVDPSEKPLAALLGASSSERFPKDTDVLRSMPDWRGAAFEHVSGLDVVSVSASSLEHSNPDEFFQRAASTRYEWDFVFITLPQRSLPRAMSLAQNADRVAYVRLETTEKGGALWRTLERTVDPSRLDLVELQVQSRPRRNRPGRFYVPWEDPGSAGGDGGNVFFSARNTRAHRGLDRMARTLTDRRVGLALGAGAALGYSFIGVLRALERHGIFPDLVAGTSMGALVGSFYASGRSVDELEDIALGMTKKRLWSMVDLAVPWKGVVVGNGVLRFLKSVLGDVGFDQLALPFACSATDINSGVERVLRHGPVAEAVRASISLPFFFEPFFWQGHYLVDGGLVNPVPSSIARAMGADVVLSVNITTPPSLKEFVKRKSRPSALNPIHGPSVFSVVAKALYTMQYGISRAGAADGDVVIAPDLSSFTWMEFYRAADIIKIGEERAERMMSKIKSVLPAFAENGQRPLRGNRASPGS